MLKAAIFDLNGIFIRSPKLSERFQKDFGIPVATFLPKLGEIMEKVRRPGAEPAWNYWEPVLKEWKVQFNEREFWNYWFSAEKVNEEMIAFSENLKKKGIKILILSNNFKERAKYYGLYPWIHNTVDKVYFSFQTGFVKPDPRAWIHLLSENNLKPEEVIYFDDQEKNLQVAEELGIESHMFENNETLKKLI